jgi:hypothetical protein
MTNISIVSVLPVHESSVQLQQGFPQEVTIADSVPVAPFHQAASDSSTPMIQTERCVPDAPSSASVRNTVLAHQLASSAAPIIAVGSGPVSALTTTIGITTPVLINSGGQHSTPDPTPVVDASSSLSLLMIGDGTTPAPACVPVVSLLPPHQIFCGCLSCTSTSFVASFN